MGRPSISITEIKARLQDRQIDIIEESYHGVKYLAKFKCLKNPEHKLWITKVATILDGSSCIDCFKEAARDRAILSLEQAIKKVNSTRHELIESTYISMSKKAEFKCLKDSTHKNWLAVPSKIVSGHGCPECGKLSRAEKNRKSGEEHRTDLEKLGMTFDPREYISMKDTLTFSCLKNPEHKNWEGNLLNVKRNSGCPECRKITTSLNAIRPVELFLEEIKDRPFKLKIDTYISMTQMATFVCDKHGEWRATPTNVQQGSGCPSCGHFKSIGETEVSNFIKSLGFNPEERNRKLIPSGEIDIYIPEKNIGIEYHGLTYHSNKFHDRNKNKHFQKRQDSEERGIKLLQFWDSEWRDKREIVKSIIRVKLGIIENKISSRKCEIRNVSGKEASKFLESNHLMGDHRSSRKLGLYFNDELVSILAYKKSGEGLDISRFCSKNNTIVNGALSKLLSYVEIENKDAKFIQYFVDLRYGSKQSMESLGYTLVRISKGFWWTDTKNIFHRSICRANMNGSQLSQKDQAELMKLYEVYDAGQAKFIKSLM